VNEEGRDLGPHETGELIVRSPVMMQGYFKDEEMTRQTIRDGWLYTGDHVYRDEDGYLFFVDRKKDIIRRKGENISATEIEITLMANPKVQEAAVIAVPSELGEDEVLAGIVLKGDQTMTAEEAIEWCQARMARFKVPRYVQFRTDFPRTPTLRVAKYIWKKEESLIQSSSDMESYKKSIGL
jgi:crotonobetaine/carnitine-CoA ligase